MFVHVDINYFAVDIAMLFLSIHTSQFKLTVHTVKNKLHVHTTLMMCYMALWGVLITLINM